MDTSTRGCVLSCSIAMARHCTSHSVCSRVCSLLRALARVDLARIFLCGTVALALASGVAADVSTGSAIEQADVGAQAPETVDHKIRIVWVLAEARSMSEAGPVTGTPEIVVYEVECTRGRLVAAKRTHAAYSTYGSRTWVVQIDHPIMSSDGEKALQTALEGVCQSRRR
jgi:hypothetical protein